MPSRDQATAAFITNFATAYDGAALGLALAFFAASSWAKYFASSSALRRIRHAPFARVADLRSILSSSPDDPDDGGGGGRLVVVRGQVQTKSATEGGWLGVKNDGALVSSQGSREMAVVVQQTQMCLYNESRGLFGWSYDLHALFAKSWNEQQSSSLRTVPFVLVEGGQCPHSAYVHVSLDNSTHPLPLTMVYHQLHPVQSPWYSFIWTILGHRYPVALLDEERILPVGKEITAVGICRNRDEALEIKSCMQLPYFLSDMTKDEIEADLTINTKILFWSGLVLGSFSISILGYAIIRNWQRWKEFTSRRQDQESHSEEQPESNANEEVEDVPDGELCIICLVRRRVYAFLPCGHRVCCQPCAISVKTESLSPKCPVCRQRIRSSVRIYNS